MALIKTTLGELDESLLARTVGFEDRPKEFVIWVEWRCGDAIVRRDAHLLIKDPVVATAVADLAT